MSRFDRKRQKKDRKQTEKRQEKDRKKTEKRQKKDRLLNSAAHGE